MPELPDISVYLEALRARIGGQRLQWIDLSSPFLLRTVEPAPGDAVGFELRTVHRIGKQIVLHFANEICFVVHLMVAGRLRWRESGQRIKGKRGLAHLDFENGTLAITEEGSRQRASLHVVRGLDALRAFDRGGIDLRAASVGELGDRLCSANHTLKRALTDPRITDGLGNAYSDEILHRARLSPFKLTRELSRNELERLHEAIGWTIDQWIAELRRIAGGNFPEKVTAFREGMAAHGRFGEPCPVCGAPIQRIVYGRRETNYCPKCQTGGKIFADRALSRLLKKDWPRSLDEL
ncbi:MAG: formamidopyrimidine-DNA glycosylase [Gemmatimonadetes bacterium]|nr:formamidopyrimidine-DNA glycosylase [Gemmatimonadota bacterium]